MGASGTRGDQICTLFVTHASKDEVEFMLSFLGPAPEESAESGPAEDGGLPGTVYFRNTQWGMSLEEVEATEPESAFVSSFGLDAVIEGTSDYPCIKDIEVMPGLTANANFCFTDNRLFMAGYEYTQIHQNADDDIAAYARIKDRLIRQYGEPDVDIISLDGWIQEPDALISGTDIASGRLALITRFQAGETSIVLSLTGYHGKTSLVENYHNNRDYPFLTVFPAFPGK